MVFLLFISSCAVSSHFPSTELQPDINRSFTAQQQMRQNNVGVCEPEEAYCSTFPLIKKHHERRREEEGGTSGHSAAFYSHLQSILSLCNDMYPCFYDMAVKRDSWDGRPRVLHLLAGELLPVRCHRSAQVPGVPTVQ